MHIINKRILIPCVVFALFVISISPVYAYVDPATGSLVIQMAIAFIIGGLFAVKIF